MPTLEDLEGLEGDPRSSDDLVSPEAVTDGLTALFGPLDRDETQEALQMVLENMVTVEETLNADSPDFLAGTQLDQPGVAGVYTIWGASTAGGTAISITLGGRTLTNAAILTLRANSEIRENEDVFFQALSRTGGRPVINVNVVTAATVRIRVKFIPASAI